MKAWQILVVVGAFLAGFATHSIISNSPPIVNTPSTLKVTVPCPTGTQVVFTGFADNYYCLTPEQMQQLANSKK